MPENMMTESDKDGAALVIVDQEIDKIIESMILIEEQLDTVEQTPLIRKLRDVLENGVNPYVASASTILDGMEEV